MCPLISVIIPVYNVAPYFPKCMESVLAQTYDNYEVILVDDGSTDSSGRMCDEYAKRDARVKAIHKPNGGLSDARNCGVKAARGAYVAFIDSDDFVTRDYLQLLWETKEHTGADISVVGAAVVWNDKTRSARDEADGGCQVDVRNQKKNDYQTIVQNQREAVLHMFYGTYFGVAAWGKLYPKDIVLTYPYPVGELYEDLFTTYKLLGACEKIAYCPKVCYWYVQRKNSIIHTRHIGQAHWNAWERALELAHELWETDADIGWACTSRYAGIAFQYVERLRDGTKESKMTFREIQSKLKNNLGGGIIQKSVCVQ